MYRVEKVLRTKKVKGESISLVKWYGYLTLRTVGFLLAV